MKISAKDAAEIGIMSATLSAGKFALSFLPNIEIVTLLMILYTIYFGKKAILSAFVFTALECMLWGFGLWVIMYMYIWPLLVWIALIFREKSMHFSGHCFRECLVFHMADFVRWYMLQQAE